MAMEREKRVYKQIGERDNMQIEVVGFIGLVLVVLFTFAELFKKREVAIIASILLILFGLMIIVSGIQFVTGTQVVQVLV